MADCAPFCVAGNCEPDVIWSSGPAVTQAAWSLTVVQPFTVTHDGTINAITIGLGSTTTPAQVPFSIERGTETLYDGTANLPVLASEDLSQVAVIIVDAPFKVFTDDVIKITVSATGVVNGVVRTDAQGYIAGSAELKCCPSDIISLRLGDSLQFSCPESEFYVNAQCSAETMTLTLTPSTGCRAFPLLLCDSLLTARRADSMQR